MAPAANSFPGENQWRFERRRASPRQFISGMFNGGVGFGDVRMCQEVVMGGGDGVRRRVCSGINVSDALDSRDREDSIDIADARGERGNANLMELNRLPPFDLSSPDFFEKAGDVVDDVVLLDDDPRNKENAGGGGRGCGMEIGGDCDSDQC